MIWRSRVFRIGAKSVFASVFILKTIGATITALGLVAASFALLGCDLTGGGGGVTPKPKRSGFQS
ncbi:MAG: hypothetical protein LBF86_02535 [Helicobacteraceae bacterium]|nr:hypothetical protein [Helicobacteraceae bacterium]